jgi:hypothetical protein
LFRRKQAETGRNNNRLVIQCVAENRPVEPALKRRPRQRHAETGEKNQPKGGVKAETGGDRHKGGGRKTAIGAQTRRANQRQLRCQGGNRRKPAETDNLLVSQRHRGANRNQKPCQGRNRQRPAETPKDALSALLTAGWRCARGLAVFANAGSQRHEERGRERSRARTHHKSCSISPARWQNVRFALKTTLLLRRHEMTEGPKNDMAR